MLSIDQTLQTLTDAPSSAIEANGKTGVGGNYTFSEVHDRQAVAALGEEWCRLEGISEGSTGFQVFAFCLTWLENYAFGDDPRYRARIVCIRNSAGQLVCLAPLAQRENRGLSIVEWVGEPLIQYGDVLLDPQADHVKVRQALFEAIDGWKIDGLLLRSVRADARVALVMPTERWQVGEGREAAIADLRGFQSAETYFARFSRSTRKGLRLKRRRLEEMGELRFSLVKPGGQARQLCELALAWKKDWLAARGLSSRAFMDTLSLKTLEALAECQDPDNPLGLRVLWLDETPIAIEIALIDRSASMAFMGMYDPAYEARSPGKVQMELTVRHGLENGWPAYDLLAPMADYKQSWSTNALPVTDVMVPRSLKGWAYRIGILQGLRPFAKKLLMAMPQALRVRILKAA
ncbi:MAG: GNAT family N-acetyltransferase [Pseudomonadota bacterium]